MADEGAQACCDIEIDFSKLRGLCEFMPRRLLVSGILVQWMRQHFTDAVNIESPFLSEALWTDDISTTQIVIDSVFKFNAAETERRPGIFIKPGPWQVLNLGINNMQMPGLNRDGSLCCPKVEMHAVHSQGSHTIFCIAGESAEAEILATEVYKELMMFGPAARGYFNFMRFVVTEIGEPAILEEATENFVVPVVVSYAVQDVWRLCPPELQEISNLFNNLWSHNQPRRAR